MDAERVIHIEVGSEFDTILSEAEGRPIVLVWRGRRFRIIEDSNDLMANYDVGRVLRGLRESAEALSPEVDAEALIDELREQRSQDSKGRPAS
jgi:hypothetical protein